MKKDSEKGNDLVSLCDEHSYAAKDNLKLCSINVCGLKSKLLVPEFIDYISGFDIVCITETKLDKFDNINIDNFTIITNNRDNAKHKSGGIAFLIKDKYASYLTIHTKSSTFLSIKSRGLTPFGFPLLLIGCYIPPEGTSYSHDEAFYDIEQYLCESRADQEI